MCSPARCRRWTAGLILDALNEPLCPSSPSGRVEAVSADQAEIVREDQLELQEYCNADYTAATRVDDGQSLCSPARCRRWTSGLISDSLDESCCRPSPSGRVETPSTSLSNLTSLRSQEHCDADQTTVTRVDNGQGRGCSALRAVVYWTHELKGKYPGQEPHLIKQWLCLLTRHKLERVDQMLPQGHLRCLSNCCHSCK